MFTENVKRPDLVWVSEFYNSVGYSEEARGFVCALDHGLFNLRIISSHSYKVEGIVAPEQNARLICLEKTPVDLTKAVVIEHRAASRFEGNRGRVNIGRTMFETDRIPDDWVEQCKRMNEIWLPSRFNIETFGCSGVPDDKLRVVPGGIDVDIYHPDTPSLKLRKGNDFIFLSVFDWADRKGWDVLLAAYCAEFKPAEDVLLLIKTYKCSIPGSIKEQYDHFIKKLAGQQQSLPRININDCQLPSKLMPGLYTGCDAFVLPSRGEAWGRPYMEAMACGLPVIGTRWGGNLEFMNDENSYLIDIEGIEDVPGNVDAPFYLGHKWAKPSVEHLRHLMRHVFEHRQEARARGARARDDICQRWTWDHAASAAIRELTKYND